MSTWSGSEEVPSEYVGIGVRGVEEGGGDMVGFDVLDDWNQLWMTPWVIEKQN